AVVTIGGVGGAAGGRRATPVDATYRGAGTKLTTAPDGSSVHLERLPDRPKCTSGSGGARPTDVGVDLGPLPLAADGTFGNGPRSHELAGGAVVVRGRFSADGTRVTGSIVAAPFIDAAKGLRCKAFRATFAAAHVKGTGGKPGDVLVSGDFANT